jgi:hypothetical protein
MRCEVSRSTKRGKRFTVCLHAFGLGYALAVALAGCAAGSTVRATLRPNTVAAAEAPPPERSPSRGPTVEPTGTLAGLDLAARTGSYEARDAVWITAQPIVVNRDFDFEIALQIADVGPAIAAGNRRQGNLALARALAVVERVDAQALLSQLCAERAPGCPKLANAQVRVFALLFGEHAARLRVVLEIIAAEALPLYSAVSRSLPAHDFVRPGMLRTEFASGLASIVQLFETSVAAPSSVRGQCLAGDSSKVTGRIVTRDDQGIVLAVSDPRSTLLRCPPDAFREASAAAEP